MSFLSDPKYFDYKGVRIADTAEPYFTLMYLPFDENAEVPQFKTCAKTPTADQKGFALYYTSGCPFTAKYVPVIEQYAVSNGKYITNEILSEKKFRAICEQVMEN